MKTESMFDKASVVECVAAYAQTIPDRLCLADSKLHLSYKEAWNCIEGLGFHLAEKFTKGSYAVVECDQSVQYLIAMLTLHRTGIIAVPLERNANENRKREVIDQTGAQLYISIHPLGFESDVHHFDLSTACDFTAIPSDSEELPMPASDELAEVLFSTGTTGKSKGIMISHRNNMAIAKNVVCGLQMPADNVEMIPMPTSHSHGLRRTYANLVNGSTVVFCDGVLAIKRMFNLMDEYQVNALDLSPAMLSIIFKLSRDRLSNYANALRYVQLGSAPLPEENKLKLAQLLPNTRLYNFYGSTEAGCSCLLDFGSMSGKVNCIGKPTANAHFVIVDDNRNPIDSSPDNMGLIASAGDINMIGYYKAPELTAKTMENGFIYTNDLGYIDDEGFVYMLGRKDDVINFGGVKIAPEEVEVEVARNPIIKDCALIPCDDPISGQIPKLFISLEEGAEYDVKEFKKFLQEVIDANKQPQLIEVRDEIPRTSNGKIRRKELQNG